MRAQDKDRVLSELESRVVEEVALKGQGALEEILAEAIYRETQRLRGESGEEVEFWSGVRHQMRRASERALVDVLHRVVRRYSEEICGKFDERVYDSVTRAGEPMLGLLLNAVSPKKILGPMMDPLLHGHMPHMPRFDDHVVLQGETAPLKKLRSRGTIILVPTHVSNMDSIAVGYAVWKLGLPPFLYGAGLNLFGNPMLGFFMRNLGAYTVDRRKSDPLYKRVLKEYCTLTLENGYDNIFFPGGTRSRSGAIEKKLKLGLLGCGLPAYAHNLLAHKTRERMFIVPATLSFQLVLEAETLIDDFLKEQGKARYIITDDEFSKPRRVFDFLSQLFSLDSKIFFTLGHAMDPMGNLVDEDGESVDARGRRVDPARYLLRDGAVVVDEQRDAELTREVGERLCEAYARDTVIQCTHITAHAVLNLLRQANANVDFVRLLRGGGRVDDLALREVYAEVRRLLDQLRGLKQRGGVRLGPVAEAAAAEDVVEDGLRHFSIYHASPAVSRRGDRVFSGDRALLFYYSNRLEGYRLERDTGLRSPLTADHRALAKGV